MPPVTCCMHMYIRYLGRSCREQRVIAGCGALWQQYAGLVYHPDNLHRPYRTCATLGMQCSMACGSTLLLNSMQP
jgi:hypothetical protein